MLNFWRAQSDHPTPLVPLIHGGGWVQGDKTGYTHGVKHDLDAGISLVALNYRLVTQANEQDVRPPVKWPPEDAVRALKFVRSKSKEWNMDKTRIGATGGSAGGCASLWLAFHDDPADSKRSDRVAHESTGLFCIAVNGAADHARPRGPSRVDDQSALRRPYLRRPHQECSRWSLPCFYEESDRLLPWIEEYSPITHVSKKTHRTFSILCREKLPV